MKTFVIDSVNRATAHASSERVPHRDGGTQFTTEKEFVSVSSDWPLSRLVAIWNNLSGVTLVRKFKDRGTAVRRIWTAIQGLSPASGTKAELVVALLIRPSGATLQEIMAATGWQAHSIRGFISAQLSKKLGLRVKSFKRDGARVYQVR
jgi:hypothetical protein